MQLPIIVIIVINLIGFVFYFMGFNPYLGVSGGIHSMELWQPFVYGWLHEGWLHLIFNMLSLFFFGNALSDRLGWFRFSINYVITLVLCGFYFGLIGKGHPPCVGASGAVFGVIGGYCLNFPKREIKFVFTDYKIFAWQYLFLMLMVEVLDYFVRDSLSALIHLFGILVWYIISPRTR